MEMHRTEVILSVRLSAVNEKVTGKQSEGTFTNNNLSSFFVCHNYIAYIWEITCHYVK